MRKAFTLIEMVVAVALLVVVMAMAGVVFRVGIESHRLALANAEVIRKFRTITDQLDEDFEGLCKDGEIFFVWDADNAGRHTGLDRMMFFSKGDFYAYRANKDKPIRGNLARIFYGLTVPEGEPNPAGPAPRILVRTQHILSADQTLPEFRPLTAVDANDPNAIATGEDWQHWNNDWEHDRITLKRWEEIPDEVKYNALSVIMDVNVGPPTVQREYWGVHLAWNDPNTVQNIFCEGVGTFRIQGWYQPNQTWIPDDDPDGDPNTPDTDYIIQKNLNVTKDEKQVAGVIYSRSNLTGVYLNPDGRFGGHNNFRTLMNEEHFNEIPGLGRALKFTFTLYDSKGLIPGGRTFTHIVYLDR